MCWTQDRPERNQTTARQDGCNYKNKNTNKKEIAKIFRGSLTLPIKIYQNLSAQTDKLIIFLKKQNEQI